MSNVRYDPAGFDRILGRLRKLTNPGAAMPLLMFTWMRIINADNIRGVMAGLDKDNVPMIPVTYRPIGEELKPTKEQRNAAHPRKKRGKFAGFGPHAAGFNNNLTYDEYVRLGGPPLAPRGAFSRVITNLMMGFRRIDNTKWMAFGEWMEVVSVKNKEFLSAHFKGAAVGRNHSVRLPVRDLRGVRPEGVKEAREAAREWMSDQIRTYG
jgi:hypothetical protein